MALEKYACRNCKVIVVANPAQTNCFVLAVNAPSLPRWVRGQAHDRTVGQCIPEHDGSWEDSCTVLFGSTFGRGITGVVSLESPCFVGNHF